MAGSALCAGDAFVHRHGLWIQCLLVASVQGQQILVNLIVNAIHAMPKGGKLVLRTVDAESATGDAGVAIQVADTGAGITADMLDRIFDPFVSTKQQEGTGLGLSISQMLAVRQAGTLTVTSGAGKGATFTLWLPESVP